MNDIKLYASHNRVSSKVSPSIKEVEFAGHITAQLPIPPVGLQPAGWVNRRFSPASCPTKAAGVVGGAGAIVSGNVMSLVGESYQWASGANSDGERFGAGVQQLGSVLVIEGMATFVGHTYDITHKKCDGLKTEPLVVPRSQRPR